jgi:hypothetical protein
MERELLTCDSLLEAIQNGDINRMRNLLSKEEILSFENQGFTPLNDAIMTNDFELIDTLLSFYKSNNLKLNAKDKHGWTPLHCAVTYCTKNDKDEEILKKMIEYPGTIIHVNVDSCKECK